VCGVSGVCQVNNWRMRSNCILADEMGLGKTAQTVCFLNHLIKAEGDPGPFLVCRHEGAARGA
jgi:SNF2 family DNA or RNA helicase